jgi:uncharacterized integral membrane protein
MWVCELLHGNKSGRQGSARRQHAWSAVVAVLLLLLLLLLPVLSDLLMQ